MKRLLEVNNRNIIEKLKAILMPEKEEQIDETSLILSNPELTQKIRDARKEIKEGKGVKVDLKDLWK